MLVEDFKSKYTAIPLATFSRNHKKGDVLLDSGTLLHMHEEMELICVLEGKAVFYIDSTEYEIVKGDIVAVSPYMLHRSKILKDHDFFHRCICFNLDVLSSNPTTRSLLDGSAAVAKIIKNEPEIFEYIDCVFNAHTSQKNGWDFEAIGYLSLIMGKLEQKGFIKKENLSAEKNTYRKILKFIAENYQNDITSKDAAENLHINNSYFCRIFKKSFGCTFSDYLNMYRVQISKTLLSDSNIPIGLIAAKCGFNSISYYSKKFKEFNSITPAEYRQRKIDFII